MKVPSRGVVILGAGGLGREILWAIRQPKSVLMDRQGEPFRPEVLGFLDDNDSVHGHKVDNTRILGGGEWLLRNRESLVIVAVGLPALRSRVVETLRLHRANFAAFISPQSIVGDHSRVGEGSIILPGAVVTTNVQVGKFVLVNPTASISHDCVVGDYTSLGPGASLAGNVQVDTCCDIGTNASVVPGKRLGPNTIVGAGACVIRDVPGNMTVVGVPATRVSVAKLEGG